MIKEIAQKTKEILLRDGWCRGQFQDDGAVRVAMGGDANEYPRRMRNYSDMERLLGELCYGSVSVVAWNDSALRTFEDVIALLDLVIAGEDAHGR